MARASRQILSILSPCPASPPGLMIPSSMRLVSFLGCVVRAIAVSPVFAQEGARRKRDYPTPQAAGRRCSIRSSPPRKDVPNRGAIRRKSVKNQALTPITTPLTPITYTSIPQLTYDPNGNLNSEITTNGTFTYTWDVANRLIAVNEPGGLSSQFTYDGLGRRVQIIESSGGAVTSTKNLIWDGMKIREERNASNSATKIQICAPQPL